MATTNFLLVGDDDGDHGEDFGRNEIEDESIVQKFTCGGAMGLSMCDNSFFSDFKDDIHAVYNSATDLHQKCEIVERVWRDYSTTRIRGYWRKIWI